MTDRECSIEGCEKPVDAKGWCSAHWARWKRHGDPLGGQPPRMSVETTLAEVLWLREGGASPHEIMVALRMTASSLQRAMFRAERPDLAAEFQAEKTWASRVSA